jgi:hypothetical protein
MVSEILLFNTFLTVKIARNLFEYISLSIFYTHLGARSDDEVLVRGNNSRGKVEVRVTLLK